MRTALEIASARADRPVAKTATVTAAMPPPAGSPSQWLEPPHAAALACASVTGGDFDRGRVAACQEFDAKLSRIRSACPELGDRLDAKREEILMATASYFDEINGIFGDLAELEGKILARASTLAEAAAARAQFDEAKTMLESPNSIHESAEKLMTAHQRLEHLPEKISGLEKSAEGLLAEIKASPLHIGAVVDALRARARTPDGHVADDGIFRLAPFLSVS